VSDKKGGPDWRQISGLKQVGFQFFLLPLADLKKRKPEITLRSL
jgi:hypothetical protein